MAETTSIFGHLARIRWPNADISGQGPFAIVSRCPERPFIRLYETAIEAQPLLRQSCGHAFCRGAHEPVNLNKSETTPVPRTFRKRPHWVKLIDLPR